MINYTIRLDQAIKTATWAHAQIGQLRKGTDIPYIIHPYGTMIIASEATNDEDILIASLFHDLIEDVQTKNSKIYSQLKMRKEYGDRVTDIVLDVSHDDNIKSWKLRNQAYLGHLLNNARPESVIVSAADKIHNLLSIVEDYKFHGETLANRFGTKNLDDQQWWYSAVCDVLVKRNAPTVLQLKLKELLLEFDNLRKL